MVAGPATVCSGSTSNYTNTTGGGTWSVTNGTGTASITSRGVLTGGNAGTVTVNYSVTNGSGCTTVVTKSVARKCIAGSSGDRRFCNSMYRVNFKLYKYNRWGNMVGY